MHELYELKKRMKEELMSYAKRGEMTASSLAMIDTLAHAIKNLDKVIERCEEEEGYSSRPSYDDGSMRGSYEGSSNRSYSGRMSRDGSYGRGMDRRYDPYSNEDGYSTRRRDSMGRYSRDNSGMVKRLSEIINDVPDQRTREMIQDIIDRAEQM